MSDDHSILNKQQRKKVRRKEKKVRERGAHRNLDEVTGEAIAQALLIAVELTDPVTAVLARSRRIDVELASESEALFVRKRVNDALKVDEWHDEVYVRVVETTHGVELHLARML